MLLRAGSMEAFSAGIFLPEWQEAQMVVFLEALTSCHFQLEAHVKANTVSDQQGIVLAAEESLVKHSGFS